MILTKKLIEGQHINSISSTYYQPLLSKKLTITKYRPITKKWQSCLSCTEGKLHSPPTCSITQVRSKTVSNCNETVNNHLFKWL